MIYLDASVALAHILAEGRRPPNTLWLTNKLFSSLLLEFEVWNRLHRLGVVDAARPIAVALLSQVNLVPLDDHVLARAREPFPVPVRTLDGLHLATAVFLRGEGTRLAFATYDQRLAEGAQALQLPLASL